MDSISISAASGMRARMESLELLANNLANVETGGYKADREFYSLYSSVDATADPLTGGLRLFR
jgi:flagellar basal body rod protein FlgG